MSRSAKADAASAGSHRSTCCFEHDFSSCSFTPTLTTFVRSPNYTLSVPTTLHSFTSTTVFFAFSHHVTARGYTSCVLCRPLSVLVSPVLFSLAVVIVAVLSSLALFGLLLSIITMLKRCRQRSGSHAVDVERAPRHNGQDRGNVAGSTNGLRRSIDVRVKTSTSHHQISFSVSRPIVVELDDDDDSEKGEWQLVLTPPTPQKARAAKAGEPF